MEYYLQNASATIVFGGCYRNKKNQGYSRSLCGVYIGLAQEIISYTLKPAF